MHELHRNSDIICCSETWLSPILSDSLIDIPGKRLSRLNHIGRKIKSKGGGVCISISNTPSAHCRLNADLSKCT